MPTAFTHIFVAGALGKTGFREKMPARFWVLAAACSVLPDMDVMGYYLGVKYGSLFGHRGFFHSLPFALLLAILVTLAAFPSVARFSKKWWRLLAFFFFVTASHGFLDSLTDKGMGVAFFSPFDTTRYFLFWRPLHASPMSLGRFFSYRGLDILLNEMVWIWLPMSITALTVRFAEKKFNLRVNTTS